MSAVATSSVAGKFASFLDRARAGFLRKSLHFKFAQNIYKQRAERTILLFALSVAVNLGLVLLYPSIPFYLAPLILGVPHLYSSLRYGNRGMHFSSYYWIWFLMFGFQLLRQHGLVSDQYSIFNSAAIVASLLLSGVEFRQKKNVFVLLVPLSISLLYAYDSFTGVMFLAIAHNFIAFIFWYRECKNKKDQRVMVSALALTVATSIALYFLPFADPMITLTENLTARSATPVMIWFTSVFIFSQSIHYFIWLKAIPDHAIATQAPQSFRGSIRQITEIFGARVYWIAIALILMSLVWVYFYGWEEGRKLYVQLSSYHGFAEIAFLLTSQKKVARV